METIGVMPFEQNCERCSILPQSHVFKQSGRLFVCNQALRKTILAVGPYDIETVIKACQRANEPELESIFKYIEALDQGSRMAVLGNLFGCTVSLKLLIHQCRD